jgi:hypothetical protein
MLDADLCHSLPLYLSPSLLPPAPVLDDDHPCLSPLAPARQRPSLSSELGGVGSLPLRSLSLTLLILFLSVPTSQSQLPVTSSPGIHSPDPLCRGVVPPA